MPTQKKHIKIHFVAAVVTLLLILCSCGSSAVNSNPDVIANTSEEFRSINISDFAGSVDVTRDSGEKLTPYSGLALHNGDAVDVGSASNLLLDVDNDKHLYADENTKFTLEATGDSLSCKTVIHLASGSVLNRLTKKLSDNETYAIETSNSTLSVRGTVFYVSMYTAEDGAEYAMLQVLDGTVHVDLIDPNNHTVIQADFEAGQAGLMRADESGSEFVLTGEIDEEYWKTNLPEPTKDNNSGSGVPQLNLALEKLPEGALKQLSSYEADGDVLFITEEILENLAQTGHNYQESSRIDPTCTAAGAIIYQCTLCDEQYTEELPATGHKYEPATTASTCVTAGNTTYTCSVCGDSYKESLPLAAHRYTSTSSSADCTSGGTTTYTCSVCGTSYTESTSALGHNYSLSSSTATCTKDGINTFTCSRCNDTYTESIKAAGHKTVIDSGKAATCTEDGLTEGTHCSVCSEVLKPQQVVKASGHTEVIDKQVLPSCTTAGKTEGSHCSVCNVTLKAQQTIAATGHTEVNDQGLEATCTESGLTTGSHCQTCGTILAAQSTIPAKGHSPSRPIQENIVNATCEEDGSYDEVIVCNVCQKEIRRTPVTINKLGHEHEPDATPEIVRDSCAVEGTAYYTCIRCQEPYTEVIPAGQHTPGEPEPHEPSQEQFDRGICYYEERLCIFCGELVESIEYKHISGDDGESYRGDNDPVDLCYHVYAECVVCQKITKWEAQPHENLIHKISSDLPDGVTDTYVSIMCNRCKIKADQHHLTGIVLSDNNYNAHCEDCKKDVILYVMPE